MRRLALITVLLIMAFWGPNTASAGEMVFGVGGSSCASYVSAHDQFKRTGPTPEAYKIAGHFLVFMSWTNGFLSAANAAREQELSERQEPDAWALWLYDYCNGHPLNRFAEANSMLLAKLLTAH